MVAVLRLYFVMCAFDARRLTRHLLVRPLVGSIKKPISVARTDALNEFTEVASGALAGRLFYLFTIRSRRSSKRVCAFTGSCQTLHLTDFCTGPQERR